MRASCETDQAADTLLRDELESPSGDADVVSVSSVGIVEIEDRFEGFPLSDEGVEPVGWGDVDPPVGEGCDEADAFATKGRITFSMYSWSATSASSAAMSYRVRMYSPTVGRLTGMGPSSSSVHDSMPWTRYSSGEEARDVRRT